MDELELGKEKALLQLGPFKGTMTSPAVYYIDKQHARICDGFTLDEQAGALISHNGRTNIGTDSGVILSIKRFYRGLASTPITIYNVYGAVPGNLVKLMADDGTITTLTLASNLSVNKTCSFQQWADYMFFCNGTDVPQKVKASTSTVTKIGIITPASAPSGADAGIVGNPNGTYIYRVTYESATHESSPGPISSEVTVSSKQINISNIPISPDSQVTAVNIYRIGGTSATWNYIGNVNNGTTTAVDNIADSAVGVELTLNRDPPLSTCKQFIVHKSRLWGLTDTTVEYSNFNEPEGWNNSNSIPLDNSASGDINLAMVSLGSFLLVCRRQSIFAIYGENAGEFVPKRLLNIGLFSANSLVSDGEIAIGFLEDGVRAFDGVNWKILSQSIWEDSVPNYSLKRLSLANKESMCGCIHDGSYYLSGEGGTFIYNFETLEWTTSPITTRGRGLISATGAGDPESIIAIRSNWSSIDKWYSQTQDLGTGSFTANYETDRMILAFSGYCRLKELHILTKSTGASFTITITYDNVRTDVFTINPANGEYQVATLSDKSICHDVKIWIQSTVSSTRFYLYKLVLYGWVERRRK